MKRIVVIGSGNVAEALVGALTNSPPPYKLVQVFARNEKRGRQLTQNSDCTWTNIPRELAPAHIYLIAVSDDQIASMAQALDFAEGVVAHTAGSVALEALPTQLRNRGVFYPLQTFTQGRNINFIHVPLCIQGENQHTTDTLTQLARTISSHVLEATHEERMRLHLAAVFANNFTNHLYVIAQELLQEWDIDPLILNPLITETTNKALKAPRARDVQTGPAVRGDLSTQEKHRTLLAQHPELKNIYENISNLIWETSKKI